MVPGVFLLEVKSPGIANEVHPGQFVMVGCDSSYGRLLRRPISVHKTQQDIVSLLFAVLGMGTEWLSKRLPGEKVDVLGPGGNGFSVNARSRNMLMVAGGMGIAPLCFLASEAVKRGFFPRLLVGAVTSCQICPDTLIPPGTEIIKCTEDGSAGLKGLVTDLLPENIAWADQVFACGPFPMYRAVQEKYQSLIQNKQFQVSLEVRMGCGLGFCYACTIKTRQGLKQVCKDGPVFELQDILWNEEI